MLSHQVARDQLAKLKKSLPAGSMLETRIEEGELWLNKIMLPAGKRQGQGSRLLARILEVADRAGLTVMLEADPTDAPADPSTYELVRWYQTFGFQRRGATDDGVLMSRAPQPVRTWEQLLSQAKVAPRLSQSEFTAWRDGLETAVAQDPVFNPTLAPIPGSDSAQHYDDGLVYGTVDTGLTDNGLRWIRIDEWNSEAPGLGNADRALRWLRERFDVVAANGIGSIEDGVGDISTAYWQRQHEKGLVDELFLDDGSRLDMGGPGRLTLIRGHQGSGKTTQAQQLVAAQPGLRHLESDQFLGRADNYAYDPVRHAAARQWCLSATAHALACGHDVVVATTFTTHAELAPYLALPSAGVRVIEMFLDYPNLHGVPDEIVQAKKAQFEPYPGAEQVHAPRPAARKGARP